MKKLLAILLAVAGLSLASCGGSSGNRRSQVDGAHRDWPHAHIELGEKTMHVDVKSYYLYSSDSNIIYLELEDDSWILAPTNHCLLYTSDRCPLCGK